MIPKIIHYCWFGGGVKPKSVIRCIRSWKKYCPDYEIREWTETDFDINCCDYVREAYDVKKWAFVSDYARFKILYQHGGIYFDTDVELIKPIDELVAQGAFMGCERDGIDPIKDIEFSKGIDVNPGLGIAAAPGLGIYKKILDLYHSIHFVHPDGTLNTKTVVAYTTELLIQHGLQNIKGIQDIAGIRIYPKEYFCPMDWSTGLIEKTKNTYSIHHFNASWFDDEAKKRKKENWIKYKKDYWIHFPNRFLRSLLGNNKYEKLKKILKRKKNHA